MSSETSAGGPGTTAAVMSTAISLSGTDPRRDLAISRAPHRRHTESDRGTTRAGKVLKGRPGVSTRRPTNPEETVVLAGVGHQVVWCGPGHADLHDVTWARRLNPLRNGEVHQAVVACSSGQPLGRRVLAASTLRDEHFDGASHQLEVLRPRNLFLNREQLLIAFLHHGLGYLDRHGGGGGTRPD